MSHAGNRIDLDRYFARIGYAGGTQPAPQTLADLHLAHVRHIPFENLDVLLGRPVQLWTAAANLSAAGAGAPSPDQSGIAQGVDNGGALLVHTDQGLQRWHAGDVSVRPA